VVGGGVIGLAVAWRAAQAGVGVTVVDPDPGGGASHAAAGMLSPVFEAHPGEEALAGLNRAGYDRWPSFAADLAGSTGVELGFGRGGALAVASTPDDQRALDHLAACHERLGLAVRRLRPRECRQREPWLAPSIRGGLGVDTEAAVDPRAVCRALIGAVEAAGGRFCADRASRLRWDGERVDGVVTVHGGVVDADMVVLATGAWAASPDLCGLAAPPVRPVKGQIVRLRFGPANPPLSRTLHVYSRGRTVYLVPRANGELVVGATVEERGFDLTVTAGAVADLLQAAIDVLPVVAELEMVETVARLRPGTPDNGPVIGATSVPGLVAAAGHYRNGVLLAPITADAIMALVTTGEGIAEVAAFGPERFG